MEDVKSLSKFDINNVERNFLVFGGEEYHVWSEGVDVVVPNSDPNSDDERYHHKLHQYKKQKSDSDSIASVLPITESQDSTMYLELPVVLPVIENHGVKAPTLCDDLEFAQMQDPIEQVTLCCAKIYASERNLVFSESNKISYCDADKIVMKSHQCLSHDLGIDDDVIVEPLRTETYRDIFGDQLKCDGTLCVSIHFCRKSLCQNFTLF